MDCPSALGLITVNAHACANYVLVPMEAQLFAMESLENVCQHRQKNTGVYQSQSRLAGSILGEAQ